MNTKNRALKCLSTAAFLIASSGADATITQQSDGVYDWQYDNVSQLQWLDLTYTDGLSVSDAMNVYGADGWIVATEAQFHSLYHNNYDDPTNTDVYGYTEGFDANPPEGDGVHTVTGQNLFDTSYLTSFALDFGVTDSGSQQGFTYSNTYGFYLDGSAIRMGGVYQYVQEQGADTGNKIVSYYDYFPDYSDLFYDPEAFGVYMVRDVAPVPVPAAAWLLLSAVGGLLGFGRTRIAV